MASNQDFYTADYYRQEAVYENLAGTFLVGAGAGAEAADMSRSDSGYHSINSMNHSEYHGFRDSGFPAPDEEQADCQHESLDFNYYGLQHPSEPDYSMDTISQMTQSDYLTNHAGSQMVGQYPQRSTPRTAHLMADSAYELNLDLDSTMDEDDSAVAYLAHDEGRTGLGHEDATSHEYMYSQSHFQFNNTSAPSQVEDSVTAHRYDLSLPSSAESSSRHHLQQHGQPESNPVSGQLTITTTSAVSRFPCLHLDCSKQFNRAADLDRHQKMVHCKDKAKAMLCDYRKCPRHRQPFHRPDHFRDHLRDLHHEDLPKRGSGAEIDLTWWKERLPAAVYNGWWRCNKCFGRVDVEKDEYRCPTCGNYCELERQAVRKLPLKCDYGECADGPHGKLFQSPVPFREHLRTVHAEDLPENEGKAGQAELQSRAWWESRNRNWAYSTSWRCTRCLDWVEGEQHGFECPRCGFGCEEVRRAKRTGELLFQN
jgi:rubrerythrin